MDIDINSIIDLFSKNFVLKDIRERSVLQLKDNKKRVKFTEGLNHTWDTLLDMRYITKIPSGVTDQEFVAQNLTIDNHELWYIISNHDDIDGQIAEFKVAFDKVYGRGFGSLIINLSADKLYLETELVSGKQNRFIGKINK